MPVTASPAPTTTVPLLCSNSSARAMRPGCVERVANGSSRLGASSATASVMCTARISGRNVANDISGALCFEGHPVAFGSGTNHLQTDRLEGTANLRLTVGEDSAREQRATASDGCGEGLCEIDQHRRDEIREHDVERRLAHRRWDAPL